MSGKNGVRIRARGWYLLVVLTLISGVLLSSSGAFAGRLTDQSISSRPAAQASTSGSSAAPQASSPQSNSLVVSQVYGGGGNSGATYRSDFVEIFNPTASAVSVTGWSIQYASTTAAFSGANLTTLTGTVQAYSYFLVKEADGANVTTTLTLPTPDITGTIAMGATGGKIALVNSTTVLACGGNGNRCWPTQTLGSLVDYVGYGAANDYEGTGPVAATANTSSAVRGGDGCVDTDNNSTDFAVVSQATFVIHNSASPANNCTGSPTTTPPPTLTPTPAPVNGTLTGLLTDDTSGSPIKASMQISGTGTFSQSNPLAGGLYSMSLAPGTYTILATASGCYVSQTIPNVVITSGGTTPLDVAFERAGGDAGGYACYENAGRSFVSATNLIMGPSFDEDLVDFNISVPLTYYGVRYMTGTISSNGFITLGARATNSSFSNDCMPDSAAPNAVIAPNWDDLENTSAGDSGVYTSVTGSSPNRTFIVEWRKVKHFTDATEPYTNTFELQVEEATGDIYMVYSDVNPTAGGQESTVGIENRTGTIAHQVMCSTSFTSLRNFMWAGNSIRFSVGPPGATTTPTNTPTSTITPTPGGPTATDTVTPTNTHPPSSDIVISEYRSRGPNGGNDEFIELYNKTIDPQPIGGLKIRASVSNCGLSTSDRVTIPANTILPPYGHYLATNFQAAGGGYSGSVTGDITYTTGVNDNAGIALTDGSNNVIDAVGMCTGIPYVEGTPLPATSDNSNRSYERRPGGTLGSAQDTNDNYADFLIRSVSDPQNLSSPPAPTQVPTATPSPTCAPSTVDVNIIDFAFQPGTQTVNLGQTVRWTNTGAAPHTSTSGQPGVPDGLWNSGTLNNGGQFTHTFNTVGTFHYYCAIHTTMEGDIVVLAGCAPTATPTNTPAATPVLVVHVTWAGINQPSSSNSTQTISMTLRPVGGGTASEYNGYTTDASGFVTFPVTGLLTGRLAPNTNYDIRVKGPRNLATCSQVTLTGALVTQKEMGQQLAGDANNSNNTNATDFTILKNSFGKSIGQPGYDARSDFNNNDVVNTTDFNLMKNSFGTAGCNAIRP